MEFGVVISYYRSNPRVLSLNRDSINVRPGVCFLNVCVIISLSTGAVCPSDRHHARQQTVLYITGVTGIVLADAEFLNGTNIIFVTFLLCSFLLVPQSRCHLETLI